MHRRLLKSDYGITWSSCSAIGGANRARTPPARDSSPRPTSSTTPGEANRAPGRAVPARAWSPATRPAAPRPPYWAARWPRPARPLADRVPGAVARRPPAVHHRRSSVRSLTGCTASPRWVGAVRRVPPTRKGPPAARAAAPKSDSSNAPASRTIGSRAFGFTAARKQPIATIVIVKIL